MQQRLRFTKRPLSMLLVLLLTLSSAAAATAWNGTDLSMFLAQGVGNLLLNDADGNPTDWNEDIWRPVGVGGGGAVYSPVFSPLDPGLWLMYCDMGGTYVTQDAGYTWSMLNFGASGEFFFDPSDENIVYAAMGGAGLFKSVDKGSSWIRIFPHEDKSFTMHRTDHADVWYSNPLCDKPGCNHAFGGRTVENPGAESPLSLPGADMAKDWVGFPLCDPPDGYPYHGGVMCVAVDPADSNKLYVLVEQRRGPRGGVGVRDHLYYSDDGGASFKQIVVDATTRAGTQTAIPWTNQNITSIVDGQVGMIVDPATGDVLLPTGRNMQRFTKDGVRSTFTLSYDGAVFSTVSQLDFLWDVAAKKIVYYYVNGGYIYKTVDLATSERLGRGRTSLSGTVATSDTTVSNMGVSSEDVIWYNNGANVFRSIDGGATFTHVWRGIAGRPGTATDLDRWAGFGHTETDEIYWQEYAVQFGSGWSSGMTNKPRSSKADPLVFGGGNNGYLVVTRNGGDLWSAPHTRIVHGYDDRGNQIDTFVSTGFNVTTTYGVHFDPFNPKHVFMSITDVGLFQSWDGGYSWRHSGISGMLPPAYRPNGLNANGQSINTFPNGASGTVSIGNGDNLSSWSNTCYWIAFDPVVPDKVYGVWSGTHDVPRLRYFPLRDNSQSTGIGGVTISYDGGRTWSTVNYNANQSAASGLPTNIIPMHIEIGPVTDAGTTLYMATHGKGFFKSVDSGVHWTQINNGVSQVTHKYDEVKTPGSGAAFDAANPNSRYFGRKIIWVDDGTPNGVVYGMIARSGAEFVGENSGQLYKSTDGGANWTKCAMPQNDGAPRPANYVSDLAYDPRNPDVLYAACWQSSNGNPSYLMCDPGDELPNSGGVFISHDAGASWKPIWGPNRHVYGIQVDPFNPNNIYAITFEGQMMIFQYEGASAGLFTGEGYDVNNWDIHQEYGFAFRQAHSPFIDVNHPDFIFVSSFGGNLWRGPSHVAPKLGEILIDGEALEGVDPNVYEYYVEVPYYADDITLEAKGVYNTANIDGNGVLPLGYGENTFEITVSNETDTLSTNYALTINRVVPEVYVTGPNYVVSGPDVTAVYTVSAKNMPPVSGIELEFELDETYLSGKAYTPYNFSIIGDGNFGTPVYWRQEGSKWIGKITLINADGVSGDADILDIALIVNEGVLGDTTVKLNNILFSYAGGFIPSVVVKGEAATTIGKYYLRYDLNKDGVVDLNDITYALQYFMVKPGDPLWDEAEAADLTGDGVVDVNDLLLILANYTIPYYK